ncbi:MAG: aromatic ring-hydroxylating dioxygenase subunit alpha [Verrucomicrobia bacterium]|nr:aromatic ring-hydroxylating dioxygenase subunit alpha [Verrucomicrobiota bacterium]
MNSTLLDQAQCEALAATYRPGRSLVREFYVSPAVYARDVEQVYLREWLFAGHMGRIPQPGDYFLYGIDRESVIVIRARDGAIHALVNVCPHRGSRLCHEPAGHAAKLVCPYHAWAFEPDGRLLAARGLPEGEDRAALGLRRIAVRIEEGLIFVCFAAEPPDFGPVAEDLARFFRPHQLARAQIARRDTLAVGANWKLTAENFFECYHCPPSHPELAQVMSYVRAYDSPRLAEERRRYTEEWERRAKALGHVTGLTRRRDGAFVTTCRIPIREGFLTQSRDGRPVAPLMGEFKAYDGGVTAMQFFPFCWFVADNDYAMLVRFTPTGVRQTEIEVTWLVAAGSVEGRDFRMDEVTWLWGNTLREDQRLVEEAQAGVDSRFYAPGPHCRDEELDDFLQWYLARFAAPPHRTLP